MIPLDFRFLQSQWSVLLFFLILFVFLYFLFFLYQHTALKKFCDSALRKLVIPLHALTNRKIQAGAILFTWLCATLALMDPVGNGHYPDETKSNSDIINLKKVDQEISFLLDVSASMSVPDGLAGQNRIDKSKELINSLLSLLKGQTVSLTPFTSQAALSVPPTNDYVFTRVVLSETSINATDIAGTDILKAFTFLSDRLKVEPLNKVKTIILFTDGGDTIWENASGSEKAERQKLLEQSLKDLAADNISLIIVGVGSPQGGTIPKLDYKGKPVTSLLEVQLLQGIASANSGTYFNARDYSSLDLAQKITHIIFENESAEGILNRQVAKASASTAHLLYDLFFQIPLAVALTTLAILVYRFRNIGEVTP